MILNKEKVRMRYTGLELFMEKLKNMIYSNDNPLINNHPSILSERPRFQLLYEKVDSVIQTLLLIDEQYHELQQVTDLQRRFKDAAEDAHDIIDLFVYNINLGKKIFLNHVSLNQPPASQPKRKKGGWLDGYWLAKFVKEEKIYLKDVMKSIESIKEEFISFYDKVKMDSSLTSDPMNTPFVAAAAGTTCTRNPLETKKAYKEDTVVGFDRHVEVIRDKLVEDQKHLDLVSIVGMGGLGKTTLATKVFYDPFIIYHFHVRGWVTVSQTYEKHDLLIQLLESIGNKMDNIRNHTYSQLRQMLYQRLMGKRYLIVIDDIWSTEAWDDLKLSFPNNHIGCRILLTSRLREVALHAKSHGFIHQLDYLTEEESWELLCKKVFQGSNDCPEWLIKPGMQIAKNCHGLPLTLVVVAGVLAKEALSKDSWERVSRSVSSYIVSNQSEYIQQLALSFDHLPGHLRDCFLYLGGFPEDFKFNVQNLLWLWVAEGFILKDGNRSLEEIGEDYLMELVDRNLVVVEARKYNGDIKGFYIHDLLRELCLEIAEKECFYLKTQPIMHLVAPYKRRRMFIDHNININITTPQGLDPFCALITART